MTERKEADLYSGVVNYIYNFFAGDKESDSSSDDSLEPGERRQQRY